ncbi:hypothetical protein AMAG_15613 [Allomyces macrogynus ATCC 38327]|uniref:Uncharacterized protein n=1 Tax=Allomyces macrogynus (strain ATCC 38327) TaxID=578462 RepID=A0A0L0T997_ALLM3|nr:hypothetical protein AMAG_15613 [Allomyces macrogynus ATCC 38327]|eukprot:KNE71378.1 hypothetical protein AMAG_15613 [Allomyces macrogynus ATCC 38327]
MSQQFYGSDANNAPARRLPSCFYKDCFCFNVSDVGPYWPEIIGYSCGGVFAIGWWMFLDAVIFAGAKSLPVPIMFDDWIPGILSTVALIMINSVDKSLLTGESYMYSGQGVEWKARLFAFIGVALGVGALGGSITILCLKYINPGYIGADAWPGIAIVVQNFLVFLSGMCLWLFRNLEQESQYNIVLN